MGCNCRKKRAGLTPAPETDLATKESTAVPLDISPCVGADCEATA